MQEIVAVPVCGYFDTYETYNNHDIEDFTMYCVECEASSIEVSILFPSLYSRCFGYHLKIAQSHKIVFTIKYFRRPCSIERVNYKTPVEALYSNENLSIDQKKNIANKTTGLQEHITCV